MAKPTDGELHWFVDQDAAGKSNLASVGNKSVDYAICTGF
jgi:hypothetical protein